MADISRRRPSRPTNKRKTSEKGRKDQQYHVFSNVTAHTDQIARQRQRRFFGILSKVVVVVGLGAGLYYGVSLGVKRLLFNNPEYNVAELAVETDGVLLPASVIEASDLHKGVNIFKVDLVRAKARVEAIPQVEKAQVARQLPNKISIQITERKPIAWVAPEHGTPSRDEMAASGKSFLIDAHGILLQPGKTLPQDYHLPIIRNYSSGPLSPGVEAEGDEIKAALDLLQAHQDSLIAARFQIQEIDLSKHYGLNVLGESGVQVLFGLDDMDKQLKHLDVYLQNLESRGQRLATINLIAQRNIPVTFITEPVADPAPAAPSGAAIPTDGSTPPPGGTGKSSAAGAKEKSRGKSHEKKESPRARESSKPKSHPHPHENRFPHHDPAATPVRRALPVTQ